MAGGAAALGSVLAGCGSRKNSPAFDFTLLDGSVHPSQSLRGRVTLMNFWATSCSVCVAEMPQLVELHQQLRPQGFDLLAVALQLDAPARVAHFAESRQLPFGVVIDNTGAIAQAFGNVRITPTFFLLDKQGRIARHWVGSPNFPRLFEQIQPLLAEA